MKLQASVPACPVCGFSSIYTDGDGPCSVRCALKLARDHHHVHQVPLPRALHVAREEAEARGLPQEPHIRDIREAHYRYILVHEERISRYWKIDRSLLEAGLNVEYMWAVRGYSKAARVYRFAPSLLARLPEAMLDYKLQNLTPLELRYLCDTSPYWHFLAAK
jgi:hypothetical protein